MATVYVARKCGAAGFERLVAIKCCHPHLRDDAEFSAMFLDEARLAASIRHPNVVATLDVSDNDPLFLVMEYIEGCSLSCLVRHAAGNRSVLPPGVALRIMSDTLAGLHAAHELRDGKGRFLNVVHRDVSPQNILVGVDGASRITDFGIAFAFARSTVTRAGLIKGKFSYLAPEHVRGLKATRRMDVFSAGIVLWEALTGRPLFRRPDDAATINAVLGDPIPPPSSLVAGLPPCVDDVVLKALERDPQARYRTAAEFADALDRLPVAHATARAVAAHTEAVFGAKLTQRRELIQRVPEPLLPASAREEVGTRARAKVPVTKTDWTSRTFASSEIEHRRLRGLLAAAMLLLVGSALGLLASHRNDETREPAGPAAVRMEGDDLK
jgi:serine/threonine-protein kinase